MVAGRGPPGDPVDHVMLSNRGKPAGLQVYPP